MTKIQTVTRFILAIFTGIASISILTVIIYLISDYERNVIINSNVDDYTLSFMILSFILFTGISVLLFSNVFKRIKLQNNQ